VTNEIIPIQPEELEIAQVYLSTQSIPETARMIGIAESQVTQYISRPGVKNYIDQMYLSAGYRNRFKIAEALDELIETKLAELREAGVSSSKDIVDLLALAHKMRMEEIKAMTDQVKAQNAAPKVQTNIQVNESPFGSGNYGKLLEKLLTNDS
jgi:predicted transcriptional regulator